MRALVQRVARAAVHAGGDTVGAVDHGFLVLLGVTHDDDDATAARLARKVARLRVFEDAAGRMNLALGDVGGAALVVSQFTLYGSAARGNRPSFVEAAPPDTAETLYRRFVEALREQGVPVETGTFRAMMQVELVNDGPVTLLLDSAEL